MSTRRLSVRNLARVGLVARGAVYFLVGALAMMVALETPGGRTTDSRGAMRELLREPMGYTILTIIACGLLCYAIWRILEGIYDYDDLGYGLRGVWARCVQFCGGFVHLALGLYALNLVFLFTRTSSRASEQRLVRWLFGLPLGDWLVGVVGVSVFIFGLSQFFVAFRELFRAYIVIPDHHARYIVPVCKYGLVARGFVFALIGGFFVNAAVQHSPRAAGGFKEAWQALRDQPHGDFLLGVVAMGFVAYAFFSGVEAIYRKN